MKFIPGFENKYKIDKKGNVFSCLSNKYIKSRKENTGYIRIKLLGKYYALHRIVAITYIPNPNNYSEINHVDKNKENNCVDNLEWCDRKYNIEYSFSKKVKCIETNVIYKSVAAANKALKTTHIGDVANNKRKSTKNLHFIYI